MLIVSNAVFGTHLHLEDVDRTGIRGVTQEDLNQARKSGEVVKLIGRARYVDGSVRASVGPERRARSDALGRLSGDAMGIVFDTDPLGTMAITVEPSGHGGGISTAMTVLRDVFNLARDRGWMDSPPS